MSYIGNSPTQGSITGGNIVDGSIESIDLATLTNIDINSGSIDGTIIGASSAAAGTFTGVEVTGDVSLGDNGKAKFGASDDLQIFHDGSNSYIKDDGTGQLVLEGSGGVYINATGTGESMAGFNKDGAVDLFHNNSKKLATTSTGVDVTGTVTADGLTVDGSVTINQAGDTNAYLNLNGATNSYFNMDSANGYILSGSNTIFNTNGSERARIDSSGNLLVGCTGIPSSSISGSAFIEASNGRNSLYLSTSSTATQGLIYFWNPNGLAGNITTNASTTSYNTTSDERLKENIQNTTHTVDINDIQVREFDWKVDGSHQRYGFIAQELETVYPEAVHSPEDADEMKSVDYSKLVPLLVKEIQQLKTRIETLENTGA